MGFQSGADEAGQKHGDMVMTEVSGVQSGVLEGWANDIFNRSATKTCSAS